MDAKQTGDLIARHRRERALSQSELAARLHVSDKAVSKWETGRGMPGIDMLEALGENLDLSVSELLSGKELTAAELPKAAAEQLVTTIKQGKRRIWQGIFLAMAAAALILAGYAGYHYASSTDGGDNDALAHTAATYLTSWERHQPRFDTSGLRVQKRAERGDYLALLLADDKGEWCMSYLERDALFPERYRISGGKMSMEAGEMDSFNFGDSQGALLIFCGGALPKSAQWYSFSNSGVTYLCPIEGSMVLDIFVVPDTHDINGTPELLNAEKRPLYE